MLVMDGVESDRYFPRSAPKNLTITPLSSLPCFHMSLNKLDQCLATGKPVRAPNYPSVAKGIIRVILTVTTTGTAKAQV
jgi:hypothetical protein